MTRDEQEVSEGCRDHFQQGYAEGHAAGWLAGGIIGVMGVVLILSILHGLGVTI